MGVGGGWRLWKVVVVVVVAQRWQRGSFSPFHLNSRLVPLVNQPAGGTRGVISWGHALPGARETRNRLSGHVGSPWPAGSFQPRFSGTKKGDRIGGQEITSAPQEKP